MVDNFFKKCKKNILCFHLIGSDFQQKDKKAMVFFLESFLFDLKATPTKGLIFNYFSGQINYPHSLISYSALKKKMETNGYKDVDFISLISNRQDKDIVQSCLSVQTGKELIHDILLTVDITFISVDIQKTFLEFKNKFNYSYGYAFYCNNLDNAGAFAQGHQLLGFANFFSSDNKYKVWRLNMHKSLKGKIRDIFPFNILNENHLEQKLNGDTLRFFIENGQNGNLSKLDDNIWIWEIEERRIPFIRKKALENNLLIM